MPDPATELPWLESYRDSLMLLARSRLDPRLRGRLDPAALVLQTMLQAHAAARRFEDRPNRRAGWLRAILASVMIDALRHATGPEGVPRERSLEQALERSSIRLEVFLAADLTSPNARLTREESLLRPADVLTALPPDQRRAVELRHFEGLSLVEIAGQMERSVDAVVGLIHRGLRALRQTLEDLQLWWPT